MSVPSRVARNLRPRVEETLADTRIVVVQGARQVGKSTLAAEITRHRGGRLVTLDDDVTRTAAATDPHGFVRQFPDGLLTIDEVQRVPELVLALKAAVDTDQRPGRYLLTGSANLLQLPATEDSLAGRAESLELFGFSQGELAGVTETFIDRLFAGDLFLGHASSLTRHDYLTRACTGSYPEVVNRPSTRRRNAWLDNYVDRIVQRDAPDVSNLHRIADLPRLLRLLAARSASELNLSSLAAGTEIPVRTLPPYLDLLETLYLIDRIPAWSTNLSKRVIDRPKVLLLDSGLAARLVNVSPAGAGPNANPDAAGAIIETFVISELRRQLGWSELTPRLFHYRDRDGAEVDLILETADGRIAAIEIKSAATLRGKDTRWIARLRDSVGARFAGGLILHTGPQAQPLGDRLAVVPIDALWAPRG
ncbi:ATP-binding protein [[Mycobacterium] zoologicum]|uniref:ATP-binding protein n=1 Tax=[Mycobacterium] zoologicum TaxID=2872311 RepID=UPI001CDB181F|nr:ATP-binding protein [Mycolicibacter sp. MYC101]MEB3062269.1 ATP-binding protein [Mycolicibacter sp. MYC101]